MYAGLAEEVIYYVNSMAFVTGKLTDGLQNE